MQQPDHSKPDVESIMADLQKQIETARGNRQGSPENAGPETDDLHGQLALANRICLTGQPQSFKQRLTMRPFRTWRAEINLFNATVVRVLNRMVRLLEGEDIPDAGPLLDAQKRRRNLTERMNDRLAELEKCNLEERLKHVEQRLRELEGKSSP